MERIYTYQLAYEAMPFLLAGLYVCRVQALHSVDGTMIRAVWMKQARESFQARDTVER